MAVVTVTPETQALLARHRVFDTPHGGPRRWRVGDRLQFEPEAAIEPYASVFGGYILPRAMGAFSYSHSTLPTHASIGRYCSFGAGLQWMGGEHPMERATTSPIGHDPAPIAAMAAYFADRGVEHRPRPWSKGPPWGVEIGHDVWIGDGVMIAQTVKIGHGAVIGARALVLKDVPPYAIVVGQPARILRYRFPEALVARLIDLAWWRYPPDVLQAAALDEPERFVDELPEVAARLEAKEIQPIRLTGEDLLKAGTVLVP